MSIRPYSRLARKQISWTKIYKNANKRREEMVSNKSTIEGRRKVERNGNRNIVSGEDIFKETRMRVIIQARKA